MKKTKADRRFRVLSALFVLLLCLMTGFPLVMTISVSLQTMSEVYSPDLNLIPDVLQFVNYRTAMTTGSWARYFQNSLVVTVITVIISLVINSMSGFVFARIPFRGREPLFMLILIGMMIPAQVTLIPVFLLIRSVPFAGGNNALGQGGTGLINTYAGLIIPYIAGSFGVFLCRQFYMGFPTELDDAARIDGCSNLRLYWSIIMPLAKPAIASAVIMDFLYTWNEFMLQSVLITTDTMKTVPNGLLSFFGEFTVDYGLLNAGVLISILPVFLVYLIFQKYFVSGMAGAVKG